MSLDFWCDILMVGSEFGVKNTKAWIHPALSQWIRWWCNGVGDFFLAHFGHLSSNWASFKCHNLEYCCWPCPSLYDYSVPIFWWTSSRIMHHVTKLKSSQTGFLNMTWVHFTQMASTVTRSQSNRAPLGCGGTGDSHHGCAADKSAATVWCYHVNMDQNLWGMFPTPCWFYATNN